MSWPGQTRTNATPILCLETDMSNSPTILAPASVQAENAHHAEAEPLNGNGFYRFKIADFQATVISDGYGPIPVPVFAANASEAELASALRTNFMQPVIQVTGNQLVVDTGRQRILVDTGFGEKLGPFFGNFPELEENLPGEHRSGRDFAWPPGPYWWLGEEIVCAGVCEGSIRLCRTQNSNYWTGSRYASKVKQFADARPVQGRYDWGSSRELATDRRPIPICEAGRQNHERS